MPICPAVGKAGGLPRFFAGLSEHRKQNSRQYGDNGDDDEQLDEREGSAIHGVLTFLVLKMLG